MFSINFNSAAHPVVVIMFYIAVIFTIIVSYKKLLPGKNTKTFLILHIIATFLLLCAIFQPEISTVIRTGTKKPILVLIDSSLSMKAKDKSGISKFDRAREFLAKNRYLRKYRPIYYSFGSGLIPLNYRDIETIKPEQNATKIGVSVLEALKNHPGNCSGVIILSDGYENQFVSWEEMKNKIILPVYTVGIGEKSAKDIGISAVVTNSPVYEGENLKISTIISQNGFDAEKITVSLKKNGTLIQGKTVELSSDFNRIEFEIPSPATGDHLYQISVQHGVGETNTENNVFTFLARVISPVINVLYVEGSLRWEYKFFKRFLESDTKINPVSLIRVGESVFQQTGGRSIEIPSNILGNEKFLQNFHIIIFGDVDFSSFSESDLQNLKNFKEKNNGSILFLGGENLLKGINKNSIRDILPITLTGNEFSFIHGPVRVSPGEGIKNLQIFEDFYQSLPDLERINVIGNVKSGCSVLFESPEFKNSPIVVTTTAPGGKCIIVATDSTWKWFYGTEQSEKIAYEKFWGKIIRLLCTPENYLGIGGNIPEILMDKKVYATGEKVQIKFISTAKNKPFSACVITPDNSRTELKITDNLTSFIPEKEGTYIVCAEAENKSNKKEFIVTEIGSETEDPGKDYIYLKKLAEISGGGYFDLDDADKLKKVLKTRRSEIKKTLAITDETEKYLITAIFAILSVCWFLRRRHNIL